MKPLKFQDAIESLASAGRLEKITKQASLSEIAEKIKDGKPALFENTGTPYKLVSNLCSRENFETILGASWPEIRAQFIKALENPGSTEPTDEFPFEEAEASFNTLPILKHYPKDGGKYITAGVFITENGARNLSYHRMMILDEKRASVRVCHRHLWDTYEKSDGGLDVAVCIGFDIAVLAAAAMSFEGDETNIVSGFYEEPIKTVKLSNGISVPRCAEIILIGKLTKETAKEGPFVDATGTIDFERNQPVFTLEKILHRQNPVYYALLPGRGEHSFLMGVSKEPVLFSEISKAAGLKDISFADGGVNWLSLNISINKKSEEDAKKAGEAAFAAHKSLKQVFVFDSDIDISNPEECKWALSTRFQADKDLTTYPGSEGSSLDPSASEGEDRRKTCKAVFDCTIPLDRDKEEFKKV